MSKTTVRNIEQSEIDDFVQSYGNPGFENWIRQLFKSGGTKPELCFVVEENGTHIGRAIYFQFEGNDSEMNLVGLALPWEGDYLEAGERLFQESIDELETNRIRKLESRCDSRHKHHREMISLFEKLGFELTQDKHTYVLADLDKEYEHSNHLVFQTLDQVGEDSFTSAIERVTVDTLDRVDSKDVEMLGPRESAREYFNILKSIDDNPDHWLLAYNESDELVGLVVAQNLSEKTGCVNYIGVIPEHRGNGYSRDLLIKASELLRGVGSVEEIIADIDTENFPLESTLSSLGYTKSKSMWIYHKYL
jgi:ribosomal protein S18 acetylase RimI-like enzyme